MLPLSSMMWYCIVSNQPEFDRVDTTEKNIWIWSKNSACFLSKKDLLWRLGLRWWKDFSYQDSWRQLAMTWWTGCWYPESKLCFLACSFCRDLYTWGHCWWQTATLEFPSWSENHRHCCQAKSWFTWLYARFLPKSCSLLLHSEMTYCHPHSLTASYASRSHLLFDVKCLEQQHPWQDACQLHQSMHNSRQVLLCITPVVPIITSTA